MMSMSVQDLPDHGMPPESALALVTAQARMLRGVRGAAPGDTPADEILRAVVDAERAFTSRMRHARS
jgi:hypothetical protein